MCLQTGILVIRTKCLLMVIYGITETIHINNKFLFQITTLSIKSRKLASTEETKRYFEITCMNILKIILFAVYCLNSSIKFVLP